MHIFFQTTALITVIISLIILYIAKKRTKEHDEKASVQKRLHKIIGPIVITLLFVQFAWAFYGRRIIEWYAWYYIHISLSIFIITGGIMNVLLGISFSRNHLSTEDFKLSIE